MQNVQKKIYACSYKSCGSVFDRPYRLQQHLLVHKDIKPYSCSVPNCSKTYTNKSHLNRHVNSVHKNQVDKIIHSCPKCMKTYANRQNLKRHIRRDHINVTSKFMCDICDKKFKKKNQLSAHMFQHNGIKAFSCDICQKDFVSLYEKKKHMRNHKTYICECCDIKFDHWSKYVKHCKDNHLQKEYVCHDCGKDFKKRSHIIRHVKTHSQVILRPYLCPYKNCKRRYSRNSNLKQHILIRHENFTHMCTVCEAELCTKAKLQEHLKLHERKETKQRVPKTLETGRKVRKDKNSFKFMAALKLAGINTKPETAATDEPVLVQNASDCIIIY